MKSIKQKFKWNTLLNNFIKILVLLLLIFTIIFLIKKCRNTKKNVLVNETVKETIIYKPTEKIIFDTIRIVKIIRDTIEVPGNIVIIDSTDTSKTFSLINEINLYDSLVYLKNENILLLKNNNLDLLSSKVYDIKFDIPLSVKFKEKLFSYDLEINSQKKDFNLINYKNRYKKSHYIYFFAGISYNTNNKIVPAIGIGYSIPLINLDYFFKKNHK